MDKAKLRLLTIWNIYNNQQIEEGGLLASLNEWFTSRSDDPELDELMKLFYSDKDNISRKQSVQALLKIIEARGNEGLGNNQQDKEKLEQSQSN
ncbi:MAG: hypothetical protein EZS28_001701 [Streblomastix strix]|uniref:Uncharacterized protein n=1 Tax=Streblomastix strix TaxID=222440 RepID=A0A5J4X7R6_9EUKA|nr:MAG: hypothetical protein EZS28_001701 [Streblomastix strix]